jgi:hypothetical protein
MTIQVELSPEAQARLTAEAVVRGIALETYAGRLIEQLVGSRVPGTGVLTPADVKAATLALTERSAHLPVLPPAATERASMYEDRA